MRVVTTLISFLLVSLLVFPMMAFAAVPQIQLYLNGKQLAAEVAPRIIKENTVVPVRIIAESTGAKVQWDGKNRKVTVDKSGMSIQLFIDKQDALVNNKSVKLETAPAIIDGNTMLPLRFVSEQLGVKVTWDELTRSVFLFQTDGDVKEDVSSPIAGEEGKQEGNTGAAASETSKEDNTSSGKQPTTPTDKPSVKPSDSNGASTDKPADKPDKDKNDTTSPNKETGSTSTTPGKTEAGGDQKGQQTKPGDKVKEPVTTIRSISLEGEQLIVKTTGAESKPNVSKLSEANRIVIDIPYSQLDPSLKVNDKGEGTVKGNQNNVSQIRYLLFSKESSIVRIIIDLSKKVDFKLSSAKTPNQLIWTFSPAKEQFKVVIDPGHGGKDTGAVSITKRYEKDFVLALGTKVYKLLEKEPRIEPVMTRDDDTFVELADRASFANEMKADLFVAIHGNSTGKESVAGVETYYYTEQSLPFAQIMHEQLLKSTQFPDRKVKQNNFYVVKNTTMPSLLLEIGFLTNRSEEAAMFQDSFQDQVAASIVAAIKQQLNID
ncbi:N-acetylmuramoyl-L-alanine amidase family protein [Paenibacillus sp. UNC451MF]|uniref:N-acetylmuramoyl-L-alanine amidase family protein n=1 Tax=Paenibacillus sp. UNC451MF TaxID=1449063 RepID=UPI00048A5E34|nr:N-acetylmuramoyl-L-alanine amidase family protein [Paenibacillus sp. UNC451MF]